MTKDEALKLALVALEKHAELGLFAGATITAIKEALAQPEQEHFALKHRIAELEGAVIGLQAQLAQPEQEPVGWFGYDQGTRIWFETNKGEDNSVPLYTAPPQRTWVGLTDEELPPLAGDNGKYMELQQVRRFYKAIEAKLKEKNCA